MAVVIALWYLMVTGVYQGHIRSWYYDGEGLPYQRIEDCQALMAIIKVLTPKKGASITMSCEWYVNLKDYPGK